MNIIPFDSGKASNAIATVFGSNTSNDLVGSAGNTGFPVISIKGKVFHITRGGERTLITKPGEDDPASSIEVVIVKANPNKSKVFYANGFVEGENAKPTCYSNNGIEPESNATEPQAKKCATCVHNQWGSKMTNEGKKSKACSDSRRLAIATVDTPNDPMLLRVPAASMKALEEFGKILAARGVRPEAVVTKVGFDYSVAHPALTFKPIGLIGDVEQLQSIKAAADSELAAEIVGMKPVTPASETDDADDTPAAPAAIQAPAPAPVPKVAAPKPAAKAVDAAVAAAATTKKVEVKVEAAPAAGTAALESEIGSMIDGMDFDD